MHRLHLVVLFLLTQSSSVPAKEVAYDLTIAHQAVNITGKEVHAMTLNGGIPGPTLRFTEGDTAVIRVHNEMHMETSIHWHGVLVPNDMDGVPFITYPPIGAGTTFTYRFPIRQSGTYWYHSHTMLQEQNGVYGSIVISPRGGERAADLDHVLVLSDWTDKNPHEILRKLRSGSDYFGIEKGTAQSVLGAAKTGKLGAFFSREAMRMPPMDMADVSYDAFLANGKREEFLNARPGQTIRLRVVDGSASTYFHLSYAGGPMIIVSADGQPVEPVKMKNPLLIAIAETYDVLIKVPQRGAYEFRASAHDGSGHTSMWVGSGEKHPTADLPKPFVYESMMPFNARRAFALTPAGTMGMADGEVKSGKFDQPGMNMEMEGMDGASMKMPMAAHDMENMEGMDHSKMAPAEAAKEPDMKEMDHSKMEGMEGMDHSKMDMPGMKMDMKGMGHSGMAGMGGMMDMGVTSNPPAWYDFLLREDAASAPRLAMDGMSGERPFAPYPQLRSLKKTSFPANAPRREYRMTLDEDMERYVWTINNKPIQPGDDILIRQGEVVRFIMINRTMMHHPMHLHGHFFRVINGQGDYSPLKHTVDVEPMSTTVIEFMADEPGDWFFHCHFLYHMMSGMARIVKYEGFTPAPETAAIRNEIYAESNPWMFYGYGDALSNETQGRLIYSNPLNILTLNWEAGWKGLDGIAWEGDFTYGRYINRFTTVFAGVYAEGLDSTFEDERLIAGIRYLLPGNFWAGAWIDHEGQARVTVERELMLTPRLGIFGEVEYDTRDQWSSQAGLNYILTQYFSGTALWDSDYGFGAGLTIRF